jgi:predicted Zn-dependent protease
MASIADADVDLKLMSASALLEEDPTAAARAAREILRIYPDSSAAALLLATASRSLGDATGALGVLDGLVRLQPANAVIRLELARAYREAGRQAETVSALQEALRLEPKLADGWRELSVQLAAAGDDRGADAAYARYASLSREPAQLREPTWALQDNRTSAAESMLRRILLKTPQDVAAMRLLAEALMRSENYTEAERLLRNCLDLAPGYSAARHDLARLLLKLEKPSELLPLVERLLVLEPQNAAYRSLQASVFSLIGRHDKAIEILDTLFADSNAAASLWMNYGHELKAAGRSRDSVSAYRTSIALAPSSGAAYWSLANLKTFRFSAAELDAMRAQLTREDVTTDDRVDFEFAIAKALEDDRRFAESFEHYSAANSLRRSMLPYDSAKISAQIMRSKKVFTPGFFAERQGFGSNAIDPIFIVGLPRAGSTLLEQILASHSLVEGTRELADIISIARELGRKSSEMDDAAFLEALASLNAADVAALADRYLDATRIYRRTGEPRFVDKMPNNFIYIGLIHLLFPRAAIIDARRHPLGCCFSCFKQHFAWGQRFTNDLADLGRYYRDYVDLMAHFDAVLPGRVHHVNYENVVKDLPREVRGLLEYCGLPFEDQCLRFFENRRSIQTASAEQVRQPIFSEGVDQWRHFEPWLGPLKEALGDAFGSYMSN